MGRVRAAKAALTPWQLPRGADNCLPVREIFSKRNHCSKWCCFGLSNRCSVTRAIDRRLVCRVRLAAREILADIAKEIQPDAPNGKENVMSQASEKCEVYLQTFHRPAGHKRMEWRVEHALSLRTNTRVVFPTPASNLMA
jgi:hypothetical protein